MTARRTLDEIISDAREAGWEVTEGDPFKWGEIHVQFLKGSLTHGNLLGASFLLNPATGFWRWNYGWIERQLSADRIDSYSGLRQHLQLKPRLGRSS